MVSIGRVGAQRQAGAVEHFFPSRNIQRIWGVGRHSPLSVWALVLVSSRHLVPQIPCAWLWTDELGGTSADKENPSTSWITHPADRSPPVLSKARDPPVPHQRKPLCLLHCKNNVRKWRSGHVPPSAAKCLSTWKTSTEVLNSKGKA